MTIFLGTQGVRQLGLITNLRFRQESYYLNRLR